jgi:electron-transferring-flavoprotein dehydrogenase
MSNYEISLSHSWVTEELRKVRNIRPGFRLGTLPGMVHAGVEALLLRGEQPWTLRHG